MIKRILIRGYRRFENLSVEPLPGLNVVVGDNESGKSTLLEAIGLALTGRLNGRWAAEELNPFWFHVGTVAEFFAARARGERPAPPEIVIELYLQNDDPVQRLRGVHNSLGVDCPGVRMCVSPSAEFEFEFEEYLSGDPPPILPVEFYAVAWRNFADDYLTQRPKELATAFIDARTIRSTSGVDQHTREMLSEHLDSAERTALAVAHRRALQDFTATVLGPINERIANSNGSLHERAIGLQMDQSARTSWEAGVVPGVEGIPFAMAGQGQQAYVKGNCSPPPGSTSSPCSRRRDVPAGTSRR